MPKGPYRAHCRTVVEDALPGLPHLSTTGLTHDSLLTATGPRESLWNVVHSLAIRPWQDSNLRLTAQKSGVLHFGVKHNM